MATATILLKKLRENYPRFGYEGNLKWASFVDVEFQKIYEADHISGLP